MDRTDIGTLLIPNVKMSDAGIYMCVGSNSVGSNSAPIKVTVLKGKMSLSSAFEGWVQFFITQIQIMGHK